MTLEQDREYAETRIRELEEELNAKNGENKMHRTTSEDIQLLKFKALLDKLMVENLLKRK